MSEVERITKVDELHAPADVDKFVNYIENVSNEKLVVIQFSAKWCKPCKAIQPDVDEISNEFVNVQFVYVDVDKLNKNPIVKKILTLPTFHFYRQHELLNSFSGVPEDFRDQLRNLLNQYSQ